MYSLGKIKIETLLHKYVVCVYVYVCAHAFSFVKGYGKNVKTQSKATVLSETHPGRAIIS